jgi:hypothetical protein
VRERVREKRKKDIGKMRKRIEDKQKEKRTEK